VNQAALLFQVKPTDVAMLGLPAITIVAAALVAATGVSAWQAVKARNAERRATTEAAIARAVNDFLLGDLLGQYDSVPQFSDEFGGDSDFTVSEAIDRAAAKIGERFQDQPLVEAAIRTVPPPQATVIPPASIDNTCPGGWSAAGVATRAPKSLTSPLLAWVNAPGRGSYARMRRAIVSQ
jgi:hypothetical protein